ncbi:proepiregulin isoform X1 [Ambystoma mexicanum]|uniref:proepiregulin isoform X1 n=1 Tax=Ambystoma mexicanum TaxID=8296 RepID=UPI0037E99563
MGCHLLTHPLLILCGLCLIQWTGCTTVIPLCESSENCTTALGKARSAHALRSACFDLKYSAMSRGSGEMLHSGAKFAVHEEGTHHVSRIRTLDCDADKKDYCLFGRCQYIVELETFRCRCQKGYYGERCVYLELVTQPMSEEYVALTAILSVLFVIAVAVGVFFAYKWYKRTLCKKQQQPSKEYKEVPTLNA